MRLFASDAPVALPRRTAATPLSVMGAMLVVEAMLDMSVVSGYQTWGECRRCRTSGMDEQTGGDSLKGTCSCQSRTSLVQ